MARRGLRRLTPAAPETKNISNINDLLADRIKASPASLTSWAILTAVEHANGRSEPHLGNRPTIAAVIPIIRSYTRAGPYRDRRGTIAPQIPIPRRETCGRASRGDYRVITRPPEASPTGHLTH